METMTTIRHIMASVILLACAGNGLCSSDATEEKEIYKQKISDDQSLVVTLLKTPLEPLILESNEGQDERLERYSYEYKYIVTEIEGDVARVIWTRKYERRDERSPHFPLAVTFTDQAFFVIAFIEYANICVHIVEPGKEQDIQTSSIPSYALTSRYFKAYGAIESAVIEGSIKAGTLAVVCKGKSFRLKDARVLMPQVARFTLKKSSEGYQWEQESGAATQPVGEGIPRAPKDD
jgi:hypothetical protein